MSIKKIAEDALGLDGKTSVELDEAKSTKDSIIKEQLKSTLSKKKLGEYLAEDTEMAAEYLMRHVTKKETAAALAAAEVATLTIEVKRNSKFRKAIQKLCLIGIGACSLLYIGYLVFDKYGPSKADIATEIHGKFCKQQTVCWQEKKKKIDEIKKYLKEKRDENHGDRKDHSSHKSKSKK